MSANRHGTALLAYRSDTVNQLHREDQAVKQFLRTSIVALWVFTVYAHAQTAESPVVPKPPHIVPPLDSSTGRPVPIQSLPTPENSPASNGEIALGPVAFDVSNLGTGINYHDGSVMEVNNQNIYFIWYGNWTNNTATTILPEFISGLRGSPYFNTDTSYFDNVLHIRNTPLMSTQIFDNYSQGASLTDVQVADVVNRAVVNRLLPYDGNGIYMVLTSPDVTSTLSGDGSFCVNFCGWHNVGSFENNLLRFGFVGNPATQCPAGRPITCSAQTLTPNGNQGADAMANVIAHEVNETVTDPLLNGWFRGNTAGEVGDLCNFNFGTTFNAPNGSLANVVLGGKDFLIQQNWLNSGSGGCALAYGPITGLCYQAHVQNIGWQAPVCDGDVAGTVHQSLRMEAIKITAPPGRSVCYQAHVESIGWQSVVCNGAIAGTVGQSLRMEALKVFMQSGGGHVEYFGQVQNLFWTGPARDGAQIGTTGQSLRLEAVVIRLLP
jgi:hypothetical protein